MTGSRERVVIYQERQSRDLGHQHGHQASQPANQRSGEESDQVRSISAETQFDLMPAY